MSLSGDTENDQFHQPHPPIIKLPHHLAPTAFGTFHRSLKLTEVNISEKPHSLIFLLISRVPVEHVLCELW